MNHRKKRRLPAGRATWLSAAVLATVLVAGFAVNWGLRARTHADPMSPSSFRSSGPGNHTQPHPASNPPGQTASPGSSPAPAAGSAASLVPSGGAYLGVYVQPALYTAAAKIAAVRAFQQEMRRPIELVHTYHPWFDPFPDAADRYVVRSGKVLLLTWSGTPDTRKIIAGDYDNEIRARATAVKRLGRPILLEFRHEMDRPNLQWAVHGPKNFIAAWDHIRAIFAQAGATNVGWVWCPTGWGFRDGRAQAFYPGASEVDWVCADIYSVTAHQPLQVSARPFLRWAAATGKPILIGEFAAGGTPSAWSAWLLAAGELARMNPQIKGMAYFDANGYDSQGRAFTYWLGSNGRALRTFRELLSWPTFQPKLPATR